MRRKFSPGDSVQIMGRAAAVVLEVLDGGDEYLCTHSAGKVRVCADFVVDYAISLEESDALARAISDSSERGEEFSGMPPDREAFLSFLSRD